jgi:hypothetical protein
MKRAYQVLAFVLAAEVVVQAMAIAYGFAGLFHWVEEDHGVVNKALLDDDSNLKFRGGGGFAFHGINGMMFIPIIVLLFLLFSAFSKMPGATKRAAGLLLLVAVQIVLGLALHGVVLLALLHALNAFVIFSGAVMTGVWAGKQQAV